MYGPYTSRGDRQNPSSSRLNNHYRSRMEHLSSNYRTVVFTGNRNVTVVVIIGYSQSSTRCLQLDTGETLKSLHIFLYAAMSILFSNALQKF